MIWFIIMANNHKLIQNLNSKNKNYFKYTPNLLKKEKNTTHNVIIK